jgi:hypothetical protein
MSFPDKIEEVSVTSLKGLGASYRIAGTVKIKSTPEDVIKINYSGVAFGGHYGGHNVNVEISSAARKKIIASLSCSDQDVENILAEVQRRLLNGEMKVEYGKLKPEDVNAFGNPL